MTLRPYLKWSLIAHLGLVVAAAIQALILPGKSTPRIPLLRVDLVALPDLTPQEMVRMQKAAARPQKEEKSSKETLSSKDRVANALARLRAIRDASEQRDAQDRQAKAPEVVKGNVLTRGQSLSEHARETGEASYLDVVRDRLEANFALPVWLKRLDPKARILLQISASGSVIRLSFVESSGNAEYDRIVRQTVEDAQPFPAPDDGIADRIASEGIVIDFPLR